MFSGTGIRIAIDRGGTFTDCLGILPTKKPDILIKLLSNDPANYPDAPTEGIRRILEETTGKSIPRGQKIDTTGIESIKMGTTIATNALLERSSKPCALVVTKGFKDLLHIGDQTRPDLFDLNIRRSGTLFEDVLEIEERVTLHNSTETKFVHGSSGDIDQTLKKGIGGEVIRILQPLNVDKTREGLQRLFDKGTVAAGGGSILSYKNGLLLAGPESAGAHPGPVAYRKGGPLTITDANLVLGRIQTCNFPKIFGQNENQPLDHEGARKVFKELLGTINSDLVSTRRYPKTVEELALGFLEVANETMCRPIRALTEAKGYRTSDHDLAVFGGAGGQHACAIAANLGINRVIIHRYSSILSAYGMALADVVRDVQEPCSMPLVPSSDQLSLRLKELENTGAGMLFKEGYSRDNVDFEHFLNLRYEGSDTTFMIPRPNPNHPTSGGTHLPDITCITPVFDGEDKQIIFYTASRGHHQEIGGILPGSMPAGSVELFEEGAMIVSEFLVRDGQFNEETITKLLLHDPAQYPGCSGTRKLADNLNDLKAQVSANAKGAALVAELINERGLATVHLNMHTITSNAEACVRAFLIRTFTQTGGQPLHALDYMDDGTPIELTITIDPNDGSAHFDFTGTGEEGYHSFNAPQAIARSATLYVLRCLIGQDIPLNEGCLRPLKFTIPRGTILNPSSEAAVCAGNPITSQRVTDVLIKAFEACAASQRNCNVFSFGIDSDYNESGAPIPDSGFGFGETICGGSGAGPGWHDYQP
ncbi:hypothetical protein BS50DRAFT_628430 [Corynespora cassiicola Philippines]|uniref:5-oxoprolinase n=1 Tax=Corynespora cassiicola Philippines TaxID=1448308 RepID=A0A2T2PC25_CORCC|nr:hypothetical protein BS50DRAFT_628430 [Corynespora cassiicola Philippines]